MQWFQILALKGTAQVMSFSLGYVAPGGEAGPPYHPGGQSAGSHFHFQTQLCENTRSLPSGCLEHKSMLVPRAWFRVSIAVRRHHDHSNSYKGKHFTGAGLQFMVGYGAGEGAESSVSASAGSRKEKPLAWFEPLKPQSPPPGTHFFQQGHTYSNKVTGCNGTTPYGGHFHSNHHSNHRPL